MEEVREVSTDKEAHLISGKEAEDEFFLQRKKMWEKRLELEKKLNLYEGDEDDWINIGVLLKASVLKFLLRVTGLYNRGVRNASNVQVKKVKFIFPNLPQGLHNFTILFTADLHLSRKYLGWYISAESILRELKERVDLVLLGGDYRYGYFGDESFVVPLIMEMFSSLNATHGIYGVLGNHDISSVKEKFEEAGIRMLVNEGVEIQHNSAKVWLGGVDDPHGFKSSDVSLSLINRPKDSFTILLSHSPEVLEESALWGVDLLLCGHTHGGQIALPLVGPIYYNANVKRKFGYGKWNYLEMQGYTSSGVGTTDVPVRFLTYPEIVLITLLKVPLEKYFLDFSKIVKT